MIQKNAAANTNMSTNDNHGNDRYSGRAAALRHRLEWVNGRQYNIAWKTAGNDDTEKKVPQRKVMGRTTRLLNTFMLWCDFASRAAIIPSIANMMHERIIHPKNPSEKCNSGARNYPNTYRNVQPINPLMSPSIHLPNTMAPIERGHIIISSKLL